MTYYNTTLLKGTELAKAKAKAKGQSEIILDFFKANPGVAYSPPTVQKLCGLDNCPLTSVRRSISNLTKAGNLVNTYDTEPGLYGAANFLWKLKEKKSEYTQLVIE